MSNQADKAKRPASQYYWGDWRRDTALQTCSLAARGLWHEMNCLMHDCEPYGHLCVGPAAMQPAQLARLVGITPKECAALLSELEAANVFSRTEAGVIFSRRMVRDEDLRERRASGGKAGAEHGAKGAEHGAKGGRPKTRKGGYETPLSADDKPPPASASASASASSILESNRQSSVLPRRDDEIPSDWLAWCTWFDDEVGIETDAYSHHDRSKFRPLAEAWCRSAVTVGLMRRAIDKARAEAKGGIAYLPAYVDRVLATLSAADASAETPYQRAARERMEQACPSIAAKPPARVLALQPQPETIDVAARRVD